MRGITMTTINEVQSRLDSYKTNKQRRHRLSEIRRIYQDGGGYAHILIAAEQFALMARLEANYKMTAIEALNDMYSSAAKSDLRLYVDDGDGHQSVPPELFKPPH